ncbi:MAG: hypothetical protein U0232_25370 [Thermomicrobiales bacterium]
MIEHCNWYTPDGWVFDEELMLQLVQSDSTGITLSGPQQAEAKAETPGPISPPRSANATKPCAR